MPDEHSTRTINVFEGHDTNHVLTVGATALGKADPFGLARANQLTPDSSNLNLLEKARVCRKWNARQPPPRKAAPWYRAFNKR
jgi:hypothetical protein